MERLTKWKTDGRIVFAGDGTPAENMCKVPVALARLAHYEDMEEQGRLVELPCGVGDAVYMENGDDESPHFVDAGKVFAIGIDESGIIWISARYESGLKYYHTSDDIGKTLFLTRSEAEAALAEKEGNKNE